MVLPILVPEEIGCQSVIEGKEKIIIKVDPISNHEQRFVRDFHIGSSFEHQQLQNNLKHVTFLSFVRM
jgi:hypothetical protein